VHRPPVERGRQGAGGFDNGPMKQVTLGAHSIRYAEAGRQDAPRTLLLFNGIGAGIEVLEPFATAFGQVRVLAFDVPGVGGSPAPLMPYRMHEIAALTDRLLDHLDVDRADVFGVSWGGAAAQEFAIRHPDRCRTLTLAATCAGFVMVPGPAMGLPGLLARSRSADAALHPLHTKGWLYQWLALSCWTSWHRLHRVRTPTLVLMGCQDTIVPPINGRLLASRLRRATLEFVDCGHHFVLTRPGDIARRVERFMFEHPAR